jgi:REP-associated tyrosine transposase
MRSLLIRIARGINHVMGARGSRVAERYHEHVLKTPTETRNALKYVLRNRAHHLAKRGEPSDPPVDRFSSETSDLAVLLKPPESWLLRNATS